MSESINDFDDAKTRFLAAYTEWKKEHDALKTDAERKKHRFSPEWLIKKGYKIIHEWIKVTPADQGGTWETFLQRVGGESVEVFSKRKNPESSSVVDFDDAKARFLNAHLMWQRQRDALQTDAERKKHRFISKWLVTNGFTALRNWIIYTPEDQGGTWKVFLDKINDPASADFVRSEPRPIKDFNDAKLRFLEAYSQWKKEHDAFETDAEKQEHTFNISWLMEHGHYVLCNWVRAMPSNQKGGGTWDLFLHQIDSPASQVFEYRKVGQPIKDFNDAKLRFLEAYSQWKKEHDAFETDAEKQEHTFNISWLIENGYQIIRSWVIRTPSDQGGTWEVFLQKISGEAAAAFNKYETPIKDFEGAKLKFLEAYSQWKKEHDALKTDVEKNRHHFNAHWLTKNSFHGVYGWVMRTPSDQGGTWEVFLQKISGEAAAAFNKYETPIKDFEGAKLKFLEAYSQWKVEKNGHNFNVSWLVNNSFYGVCSWVIRTPSDQGGTWEVFLQKISGEAATDFVLRGRKTTEEIEKDKARAQHEQDAKDFIHEMFTGSSEDAIKFRKLLERYKGSFAADLLFKFRPDFKDIPIEKIHSVIAEYIGKTTPGGYTGGAGRTDIRDLQGMIESDPTLFDVEVMNEKQKCLEYYYAQRKAGSSKTSREIVYEYFDILEHECRINPEAIVQKAATDAVVYFEQLFTDIHQPEQLIESFGPGREYPDVNQRVNTRELQEKHRLLVADEMGLGKSASVIFAKEYLGVKCALITAPSNVIETWLKYLSSDIEQGGCYKPGMEPRVLVVEDVGKLETINTEQYDYVLISHERLNERYLEGLQQLDFGMMAIDEIHLLKAPKGVRATAMMQLAAQISEKQGYLAMLSGTPVPNKVGDVANILKLLHPGKYAKQSPATIRRNIVDRGTINLRLELIPYMQMKRLEDTVELPERSDAVIPVRLSPEELAIYKTILDEDEMDAKTKLRILQAFLINPRLVDMVPEVESSKITAVRQELTETFQSASRVLMFVNNFITDVIRGEQSIIEDLGLDPSIKVLVIHGDTPFEEREAIHEQFQKDNGKMLLIVSGKTSSVGVNLSAAQYVYFFTEPWTHSEKMQQIGRANRRIRTEPLHVRTFIAAGTAEEGIHRHIQIKQEIIEKLLRGIPPTEREKLTIKQAEKDEDGVDIEVEPDLARFYFSAWQRLMEIFKNMRNIGEEGFKKYLENEGDIYAEVYRELGSRSYQANANRVSGTLIDRFVRAREQTPEALRILDIASGPEMLRRHIHDTYRDSVVSLDMNEEHFKDALPGGERVVGSFLRMPFDAGSFDYANFSLGLHYATFAPSQGKVERVQALHEINRVLKPEGRAVVTLTYSDQIGDHKAFERIADLLGFRLVSEYSGNTDSGDGHYVSWTYTLEKVRDCTTSVEDIVTTIQEEDISGGLKFGEKKINLDDSRRIITQFWINNKNIQTTLNEADRVVMDEERSIIQVGEELKHRFGGVREIPREEVVRFGFSRVRTGKEYILFKKLKKGPGAVVIH